MTRLFSRRTATRWRLLMLAALVVAAVVVVRFLPGPAGGTLTTDPSSGTRTIQGTVTAIADGDTITVLAGRDKVRVRLLGIDAPEVAHETTPAQCGADDARTALARLVPIGTPVTVTTDPRSDATDQYGRTLGYVASADVEDAALALLEAGLVEAWVPAGEPHPTRWQSFTTAQRAAQAARAGSWATCDHVGR